MMDKLKEIDKLSDISLVFSALKSFRKKNLNLNKSLQFVDIYLKNKYRKVQLMDKSAYLIDGMSKEGLFRIKKYNEYSLIGELERFSKQEINETLKEVDHKSKSNDTKYLIYPSRLSEFNIEHNKILLSDITNSLRHFENIDLKNKFLKESSLKSLSDANHQDLSMFMEYIHLPDVRIKKLNTAFETRAKFTKLDHMLNYALDWLDFKNEDEYNYSKFLTRSTKLNNLTHDYDSLDEFISAVMENFEYYAHIGYLKDEHRFKDYLRKVYKRSK